MKRNILILTMLCFAMSFVAQEVQQAQDTIQLKGAHPWRNDENKHGIVRDFTHLSISPMIGFNVFDGDFRSEMKHAFSGPSLGMTFEYNFTPVWSMGIEYMFSRYQVHGKPNADNASTLLQGGMHKLGLNLGMDAISLFFPHWNRKLFNGFAMVGAGYMWYNNSVMYMDYTRAHTASFDPQKGSGNTFFIQMGAAFEVNLNRTFAVGLRATYAYLMNDYMDGRGYATDAALASKNNDGIFDVVAYMRVKFNAVKKTHTRNIYSLDSWKVDDHLAQVVHDTVIIRHDSVIVREQIVEKAIQPALSYYVYFANNSYELTQGSLLIIQQASDRMFEDPSLYAIITGYCDNTGTNEINNELGEQRAHAVVEVLRDEYGVPESHMFGIGQGVIAGPGRSAGSYGANRRTQIRLVDRATYIRLRIELEEKRDAQRNNLQNEQ